jgi:hypothetical protein
MFLSSEKLSSFTGTKKGVGVRYGSGPIEPFLYVFPTSEHAPMSLLQIPAWISCRIAHPSFGDTHHIRVPLTLR